MKFADSKKTIAYTDYVLNIDRFNLRRYRAETSSFAQKLQTPFRSHYKKMVNQFNFKNFEPDEATRAFANKALARIMDQAPFESNAAALIEKDDTGFRCSIAIYSRQGPFIANIHKPTSTEALNSIEEKLTEQIQSWWKTREEES